MKTLSNGIIIEDNRSLGCGILIKNQNTKHIYLRYLSDIGFYLIISNRWFYIEEIADFQKELEEMRLVLIEANELIKTSEKLFPECTVNCEDIKAVGKDKCKDICPEKFEAKSVCVMCGKEKELYSGNLCKECSNSIPFPECYK